MDNWNLRKECIIEAKKKKIELHARSVFLQGLFFKMEDGLMDAFIPLKKHFDKLKSIAKILNVSWKSLCLSYVQNCSYIDNFLIGVDNSEQLVKNIEYLNKTSHININHILEDEIKVHQEYKLLDPRFWDKFDK